jgi:hypothetical protein
MSSISAEFEEGVLAAFAQLPITGASLENGLLQVDLLRVVPEATKAQAIPIATAKKVIEDALAKIAA